MATTLAVDELKIKSPCGIIIAGSTSSGKTSLLLKLIKYNRELIEPPPKSILYCYGQMGEHILQLQDEGVECWEGTPPDAKIHEKEKPLLLIYDDLMGSVGEKYIADIYTKRSHHENLVVVFLTQNLFDKAIRVARNNAQYIFLTRSVNSMNAIRNIGSQLFPRQLSYFLEAYTEATKSPYGYLFIDLHASGNPLLHLRSQIFPDDLHSLIYVPK